MKGLVLDYWSPCHCRVPVWSQIFSFVQFWRIRSSCNILTLRLPKSRNCLKAVRALFFMHNLTRVFGQCCLPKTAAMYCSVYPFRWGKVNRQCINQLLIGSSTKNSKILIILKEVIIRPLFKDPCHIIIFQNKRTLQRTTFSCKSTERDSCWL